MLTMFVPLFQDSGSPMFNTAVTSGYRSIMSGIFLALYPLGQFIGSPIIGSISDRLGRKKVLAISLFFSFISLVIITYSIYSRNVLLLGASCFVAGLCESNMAIALSAIACMTKPEERQRFFGYAWMMCSVGYILGSMYGGLAAWIGYTVPFALEALGMIVTMLLTLVLFQDAPILQTERKRFTQQFFAFFEIFKNGPLRPVYLSNFLLYFAFFGILRVELIFMQDTLQLTPAKIAFYYSYSSVVALFANLVISPWLSRFMSMRVLLVFTTFVAASGALLFVIPRNEYWLYLTMGLIALSVPVAIAVSCAFLSSFAKDEDQGAVMGNNQSLQVLSEALSAAAGGLLFAFHNSAPFFIFGGLK